jgi:hypothetical protein
MEQILININSKYTLAFLNFLKTLNYVEVKKVGKNLESMSSEDNSLLFSLSGAWEDERTTEEIINDIHLSRHFEKTVEVL